MNLLSNQIQASVRRGLSPAMGSSPACLVLRGLISQTWDGRFASPVGEDLAPSGRAPAPSTTVKSKVSSCSSHETCMINRFDLADLTFVCVSSLQFSVLQVTITTPRCTGVSAAQWAPIRQSSGRTTALPALGTPPLILMVQPVSLSARVSVRSGKVTVLFLNVN